MNLVPSPPHFVGERERERGERTSRLVPRFQLPPHITPHPAYGHLLPHAAWGRRDVIWANAALQRYQAKYEHDEEGVFMRLRAGVPAVAGLLSA
jgi:hypothetical protein